MATFVPLIHSAHVRGFEIGRRLGLAGLRASLLMAAGCASGWDGERVHYKSWQPAWKGMDREATFRVGDPGEGWRPHRERGVQVAWSKGKTPAVIQVRSQCDEHGDSDLASFTDHLRIDFGQWEIQSQRAIEIVGREGLRTRVQAELDGVPVHLELVVLKKNGCLFDLQYITRPAAFDAGLASFDAVLEGFAFPLRGKGRR